MVKAIQLGNKELKTSNGPTATNLWPQKPVTVINKIY